MEFCINSIDSNCLKCQKQPKSLKRSLTSAGLYPITRDPQMKYFRRTYCGTCHHIVESSGSLKLNSENSIYVLLCSGCGDKYIGQTSQYLPNCPQCTYYNCPRINTVPQWLNWDATSPTQYQRIV